MSTTPTSIREYVIKIINGMALGLFASLIIGLILRQIGDYTGLTLLLRLGSTAQLMMGPAIGAGVAFGVGATGLGMFASVVTGAIGAGTVVQNVSGAGLIIGEPVGAYSGTRWHHCFGGSGRSICRPGGCHPHDGARHLH